MSDTGPELPGLLFIEKLGSGGFSDVYLYERDQPRIKVAVKLMRSDVLDETQRRQFAAEADAMAELAEHPYIVPVLGAGTAPDGRPYLVMRFYPPPDLGVRVEAEPLSVADALRTGIQLASAIETAHRAGIIHRDIKPGNVLISSYGSPGLTDFGIAGRAAEQDDDEHLGVSLPWSPPEVLTGASNGSVTSDVYSLGATIWNLLVGRSPYAIRNGDNSERAMFTRIVHSKPPTTGRADVPGSLDRLLQQCMAKSPDHRPQSALEVARHLQRVEQELRLSRTEIEVLDSQPEASPATASFAPPADPTAAHRPAAVAPPEPASPVPPMPAAPASSPDPGPGATRRRAITRAEPPTGQPGAGATRRRSIARATGTTPTATSTTASVGAQVPAQPGATVQRTVQRATPAAPQSADVPESSSGRGRMLALAAGAVLLVAAIGIGAFLNRGGSPSAADDLPNGSGSRGAKDVVGTSGDTPPSIPSVSARTKGGKAIFTWESEQAGDYYRWNVNGGASSKTTATRVVVDLAAEGQTCISVTAFRGTEISANPGTKCVGG